MAKTVSENLKMNPALLSRFDLIFILLDKPDEEKDKKLSEHVLNVPFFPIFSPSCSFMEIKINLFMEHRVPLLIQVK